MNEPKTSKRTWPLLATALVVLLAVSGGFLARVAMNLRNKETAGQPGNPFVFLVAPNYRASPGRLDSLVSILKAESGMSVEIRVAESDDAAVRTGGTDKVDAWLLPLFGYLFSHQEYKAEAGLQVLRGDGARAYRGVILVTADSGIAALRDLNGRRIAYVDPYSTSGFLYPASLLREAGIEPHIEFLGSHEAVLSALRSGRVDAAATYADAANGDKTLSALATTAEIPNEPVFFRGDLNAPLRRRFEDALLRTAATPEGRRALSEMANIAGFTSVTDALYLDVDEVTRKAGKTTQDLVQRGWLIHNENQRPFDPTP